MKTYHNNQKGFAHNIALFVLAFFVLGVVGFAGFEVYKNKNDTSASAAGWTSIAWLTRDINLTACRASNTTVRLKLRNWTQATNVSMTWVNNPSGRTLAPATDGTIVTQTGLQLQSNVTGSIKLSGKTVLSGSQKLSLLTGC